MKRVSNILFIACAAVFLLLIAAVTILRPAETFSPPVTSISQIKSLDQASRQKHASRQAAGIARRRMRRPSVLPPWVCRTVSSHRQRSARARASGSSRCDSVKQSCVGSGDVT